MSKPDSMKWERVKVEGPKSAKNKQSSTVFRARAPKGWFVAFDWGNGVAETIYVPEVEWDVALESDDSGG